MQLEFEALAVERVLLHLAKFPYSRILGLLLGTDSVVSEVLPLLHSSLHLSSSYEIAWINAQSYAKNHDLSVLGVYYASDRNGETSIPAAVTAFSSLVRKSHANAVLLTVESTQLKDLNIPLLFTCFTKGKSEWLRHSDCTISSSFDSKNITWKDILSAPELVQFVDFDCHLNDITYDWTNSAFTSTVFQRTHSSKKEQ
eukprot:GCRY01001927.1.p1 GENE.GCRY01001927.1~~GCRY01001927.1.p1  ORF type:complete len:199 (+),score=19.06 GCRY01001927.1:154-750(+)